MTDHTMTAEEQLEKYRTHPQKGLTLEQAQENLAAYGENLLESPPPPSFWRRFLAQMRDPLVLLLLVAAALSFFTAFSGAGGGYLDPLLIMAIVLLGGLLGAAQETRAQQALDALRELSAPWARVRREGRDQLVPWAQVVPGDLVLLEAGDAIPCDGRILHSASLQCEESALTGESLPAAKEPQAQLPTDAPLGDRRNMVYAGCTVSTGRATVLCTRTGMHTELGKIAGLLEARPPATTPLQQKLARLSRTLGLLALAVCAGVFALGLLRGMPFLSLLLTAVALAVAAVPEGLSTVVTVVLALGVRGMARHNAIVRSLPAVETLGSATVICTDKTGTLTRNSMAVESVWPGFGEPELPGDSLSPASLQALRLGVLCSDGQVIPEDGGERHLGDPTETAVIAAALARGISKEDADRRFPRVAELPFDSHRKRMSTVHRIGGRLLSVTKGAPDAVLPLCTAGDSGRPAAVNEALAEQGLRVLAVACRELPPDSPLADAPTPAGLEQELTFAGLIALADPLREESPAAVETCRKAGIQTVMITGDHIATACAIASRLGLLDSPDQAVTGAELQALSEEQLAASVARYRVFARVSPEDKLRIVRAWQQNGAVVAMTGDGVNDAPALKAADVGCAMGITGTDVARAAADIVLTDDNFSTIVRAVRSGRGIYGNITRSIRFLLGSNLGEVLAVFLAMLLGWGSPLLAIHLLLVNVVTDGLPALALGVEPTGDDLMDRPPLPRERSIFAGGVGTAVLLQGLMIGLLTLAGYGIGRFVPLSAYFPPSPQAGMTMAFLVLALSQLVQAFNCRSDQSLFRVGFFSSPAMTKAFLASLAVVLLVCLVPPLEALFGVVDLSVLHWLWVLGLSLLPLPLAELRKALGRRG